MLTEAARGERGFLRRLALATAWGEGLDGYDLGVLSVVLPLIATRMHISPVWAGLIGASSLIGIFLGSPIVGYLTGLGGRGELRRGADRRPARTALKSRCAGTASARNVSRRLCASSEDTGPLSGCPPRHAALAAGSQAKGLYP